MPRKAKVESSSIDQTALAVDDKPDQVDATVEVPSAGLVEALQAGEFDAPRHDPETGEILEAAAPGETAAEPEPVTAEAYQYPRGMMEPGTLTGDSYRKVLELVDLCSDQPLSTRPAAVQTRVVDLAKRFAMHFVDEVNDVVIDTLSAGLRKIPARVEQVTFKDGIKAVLTVARDDQMRHHLADATGARVLIVVAEDVNFVGERAPYEIVPDQADLVEHIASMPAAEEEPGEEESEHEEEPAMALPPGAVTNGSGTPTEHAPA